MITPYESYVAVCEKLNALTPGDHEKRTFLVNSGAEAVENAVKVARSATGRPAVVAFDHGYHGRTLLTMTLTAKNMPYKQGFGPYALEVYRMPLAYPFRWPGENVAEEAAAQAIDQITKQIGAENVAAVIIEPIAGEGGFIVPAEGFLPRIAEFCKANGIVFIADEIQTGFARTGQMFACEDEGIVPDIITTAKGIAGGLPLAAVTGRAELMDAVHAGGLGGTYGGNPAGVRGGPGRPGDDRGGRPGRAGPRDRRGHAAAPARPPGALGDHRGRPGTRRDDRDRAGRAGDEGPQSGRRPRSPSGATPRGSSC